MKRQFLFVFFSINLLLSSYYIDAWNNPNPVSRALSVLALSEDMTLKIDKYADLTEDKAEVDGHFYSEKAPLPTFIVFPFYAASKLIGLDERGERAMYEFPIHAWRAIGIIDGRQYIFDKITSILWIGSFICGSLPFAAILLYSFVSISPKKTAISPVVIVMMSFYGSFLFVYSGTYFNHILAGFLLLTSYMYLKKDRYFVAGIYSGLSFMSEYSLGMAVPLWALLIMINNRRMKWALQFIAGTIPMLLVQMIYNYHLTSHPLKTLYRYHSTYGAEHNNAFGMPTLQSLWGLSFSASMGIFVFTPILVAIAFYILRSGLHGRIIQQLSTNYVFVLSSAYFIFIASFFIWWGGWSYGPRYLIVIAIPLVYEGLSWMTHHPFSKSLFLLLTGYGLLSSWVAKSTLVYNVPDLFLQSERYSNTLTSILIPELLAGRYNANNVPSLAFGVPPHLSAILWLVIFGISMLSLSYWHRKLIQSH